MIPIGPHLFSWHAGPWTCAPYGAHVPSAAIEDPVPFRKWFQRALKASFMVVSGHFVSRLNGILRISGFTMGFSVIQMAFNGYLSSGSWWFCGYYIMGFMVVQMETNHINGVDIGIDVGSLFMARNYVAEEWSNPSCTNNIGMSCKWQT